MKKLLLIIGLLGFLKVTAQNYTFHKDVKFLPEWSNHKSFEKKYNLKALEYKYSETKLGNGQGFSIVKFEMRTRNTENGTLKIEYFLGSSDQERIISQISEVYSSNYKLPDTLQLDTWNVINNNLILNKKLGSKTNTTNSSDTTYSYYIIKPNGHLVFMGSTFMRPLDDELDEDSIPMATLLMQIDQLETQTDGTTSKMTTVDLKLSKDTSITAFYTNAAVSKIVCKIQGNERIEMYFDATDLKLVKHELKVETKRTGKYYFWNGKMILFLKNELKEVVDVIAPEFQKEETKYLQMSKDFLKRLSEK